MQVNRIDMGTGKSLENKAKKIERDWRITRRASKTSFTLKSQRLLKSSSSESTTFTARLSSTERSPTDSGGYLEALPKVLNENKAL